MASVWKCAQGVRGTTIGLLGLVPRAAPSYKAVRIAILERMVWYSHLGLDHLVHQLMLPFGNLNHLLDQPCSDPVLQFGDAGLVSGCNAGGMGETYASAVYSGSCSISTLEKVLAGS